MKWELIIQILKVIFLETTKNLMKTSDEKIRFENTKIRAYKDDIDAQYQVGQTLMKVLASQKVASGDFKENEREGLKWVRKAADNGHIKARYELAKAYEDGKFTLVADEREAFKWYKKAAYQGYVNAQFKVADMYEQGRGTDIDIEKSEEWLKKGRENAKAGRYGGKKRPDLMKIMEEEMAKNNRIRNDLL